MSSMNPLWILVCNSGRARIFEIGEERFSWSLVDTVVAPDVERAQLVTSVVAKLDAASRNQRFDAWMLVAPPHFLAVVKDALTDRLRRRLTTTVEQDLNHLDARALADRLRYSMPASACSVAHELTW